MQKRVICLINYHDNDDKGFVGQCLSLQIYVTFYASL